MTAFDLITGQLERYATMYAADLKHLSDANLHQVPMGAARTVADFTAEIVGFNQLVAATIHGEPVSMPDDAQRAAFAQSIQSIEQAGAMVKDSAEQIGAALRQVGPEGATAEVMAPWGEPTNKLNLASMAASHMMYHDGQVNYIQSLHGDSVNHWFEE